MKIDREQTHLLKRKFYRRISILTWLLCATILNAVDDKLGSTNILQSQTTGMKIDLALGLLSISRDCLVSRASINDE